MTSKNGKVGDEAKQGGRNVTCGLCAVAARGSGKASARKQPLHRSLSEMKGATQSSGGRAFHVREPQVDSYGSRNELGVLSRSS